MSLPTTTYNHKEYIFGHIKYLIKHPKGESASYDVSEIVGYKCSIELSPWSQGVCWRLDPDSNWRTDLYDDPKINFSFLIYANKNNGWEQEVSEALIHLLLEFEKCHQISMYQVIWILSRSQYATEFLISSPLLFWIILDGLISSKFNQNIILKVFESKRSTALTKLGYPSSKSVLKFIDKITYKRMNRKINQMIWNLLSRHDFQPLNHRENIPLDLIAFLVQNTSFIPSKFVKTIEENFNSSQYCQYIRDTILMSTMLGRTSIDAIKVINNCKDFDEIKRYHDRISNKIARSKPPEENIEFKPTTLKGTQHIVPILSLMDLRIEGMQMKHCIRSYKDEIIEGNYAAFKIIKPERATLGIHINKYGKYSIDQLQGIDNEDVSWETKYDVYNWFRLANKSA